MNENILVTLEDLKGIYKNNNCKKFLKYALERKIIPLKASPELAQICGHLIGDGHLRISKTKNNGGTVRFFGEPEKLTEIAKIYEKISGRRINLIRKYSREGFQLDVVDSIFARCLNKIGVPSGDKVLTNFKVPYWIMNGEKEIKRKFLQALFDDELEGIHKGATYSWKGLRLRMNKSQELIPAGLEFFNQIRLILNEFNIETTDAKAYNPISCIRQSGICTYQIVFRIKNQIDNRRRFYEEIGFIYSKRKQEKLIESLK
ncbi:MAG TPA: hypothetical protein VJJ52_03415 [Candidatus Nanoarchaeia archaeon]|nr:hypothetical protein [Candidatus Nanoarchaeia archaeon]